MQERIWWQNLDKENTMNIMHLTESVRNKEIYVKSDDKLTKSDHNGMNDTRQNNKTNDEQTRS